MLIALLALLGVNLAALLALAASVLTRKRWIRRQPGAFHGAIRVDSADSQDVELLAGPYRELVATQASSAGL